MTTPLINAALIPAAVPGAAARKPDAQAYAAAMRAAGGGTSAKAQAQPAAPQPPSAASFSRESPFATEPSRPMRPGSILDIRV